MKSTFTNSSIDRTQPFTRRVTYRMRGYQGNILAVIDCSTDSLEHLTDYYAYGQPHPDCVAPELSARKYSAKELLTYFGLDEYDFAARRLTLTGRFTQPDPLGYKYPNFSPYAYCAADPINLIDPSGMNPIYNSDGVFLGTSREGLSGMVYIYHGSGSPNFSSFYMNELLESEDSWLYSRIDGCGLSMTVKTSIFNHILSQFEGWYIGGRIFSMSSIHGGQVYYDVTLGEYSNWRTSYLDSGNMKPMIRFGPKAFVDDYEITVENLICTVLIHEWLTHGILHFGDDKGTHWMSYLYVISDKFFFPRTTSSYKSFYYRKLNTYLKKK